MSQLADYWKNKDINFVDAIESKDSPYHVRLVFAFGFLLVCFVSLVVALALFLGFMWAAVSLIDLAGRHPVISFVTVILGVTIAYPTYFHFKAQHD